MLVYLVLLAAAAVAAAVLGVWLTQSPSLSRRVVPFSGGVLVGIALFWLLPELRERFGWLAGAGWLATGFGLLWFIDRYVYPVCPSCSSEHDHSACATRLHGFATPLVLASMLHCFLDGLGIGAALSDSAGALGAPVLAGTAMHKLPEGLAQGVILRAAVPTRRGAILWCVAIQAAMLLGGVLESVTLVHVAPAVLTSLLALAAGSFLYLGYHAVHGEWRRRGSPAIVPALTGAAGAAAIQVYRLSGAGAHWLVH